MQSNCCLTSVRCCWSSRPRRWRRARRCHGHGFTLVELLVVITIIGILASLITVAASAALDAARRAAIKTELDQIATAFQQYKNEHGSYPPSFAVHANQDVLVSQIGRHMKKAFPRSKDTVIIDDNTLDSPLEELLALDPPLNAAESVVFWLGGFSADPEYPLTGPGGPLARPKATDTTSNVDDRTFLFGFDKSRLTRTDDSDASRPPARTIPITTAGDPYEVDLPEYYAARRTEPYVYFDTSRFVPERRPGVFDSFPGTPYYRRNDHVESVISAYLRTQYDFVDPDSFQVISAGTDDDWGDYLGDDVPPILFNKDNYGPFVGGHTDNIVNFSQKTLEDSQP